MGGFTQSLYKVAGAERIETFLGLFARYYPEIKWKVSLGNTTIKATTAELRDAVRRLFPDRGDVVLFKTERHWGQLAFSNAIPLMDYESIQVTEDQRERLYKTAKIIAKSFHASGMEVF